MHGRRASRHLFTERYQFPSYASGSRCRSTGSWPGPARAWTPAGDRRHAASEWVFPLRVGARCRASKVERSTRARASRKSRWQHRGHDHGAQHVRRPPRAWNAKEPWNGWWGENPPYHHPVFVLTHHAREPLKLEGDNTFTFVTDGIASALEQARRAAGAKDVCWPGGAKAAQQYRTAAWWTRWTSASCPRCWRRRAAVRRRERPARPGARADGGRAQRDAPEVRTTLRPDDGAVSALRSPASVR